MRTPPIVAAFGLLLARAAGAAPPNPPAPAPAPAATHAPPPARAPTEPAPTEPAPAEPAPTSTTAAEPDDARADAPADAPRGSDELDVHAASRVRAARRALDHALGNEGYRARRHTHGYTVYRRPGAGHPVLLVYDDGWVRLQRQPLSLPRIEAAPVDPSSSVGGALQVVTPFSGPRVGNGNAARVLTVIQPTLRDLANAVAAEAMDTRENVDIPAELDAIWARPDPAPLRRAALLSYWDERTETPEGERAREAIERFLTAVVSTSDTPFTRAEIAAFNLHRQAERALVLRFPE
jgi:hypothetical protein